MYIKKRDVSLVVSLMLGLGSLAISPVMAASHITDFDNISNYAKNSVRRLDTSGVLESERVFNPKHVADKQFARNVLGTLDDIGTGQLSYSDAIALIKSYQNYEIDTSRSIEGLLTKKNYQADDLITREDFAYLVAHAKQENINLNGLPLHNPAIAKPGPLLGPTVYQTGSNEDGPTFDGSTISLFHRAKNANNTTFNENPVFTLQVHPEVFKSVSVGGIDVDQLNDMTAQFEVELTDGTIHRTSLNSLIQFSIHGADGKVGQIRVEDGVLALVDDLKGYVSSFKLNGHDFNNETYANLVVNQSYTNNDQTDEQVVDFVSNELTNLGFSLQDRRTVLHNLILTKTALQQSNLSPLSAPFNTIAGPSSKSRGFEQGVLYNMYQLVYFLNKQVQDENISTIRSFLNETEIQQQLLTATKILTAATLLPHITSLADAPFLPNEALTSRVKKAGALLPSEPIVFQYDKLKRAAYILLDDALSQGNASHLVTTGEITSVSSEDQSAFTLIAEKFNSQTIAIESSIINDAILDYLDAYENIVKLISGVNFEGSLVDLTDEQFTAINASFSKPILDEDMSNIKIGELEFKLDILATPSHIGNSFKPLNPLTQGRVNEAFGLEQALEPFPTRLAQYVCAGEVVNINGEFIADAKIDAMEQIDLIQDFSINNNDTCEMAITAPRYHQLLFVDNFQLPPFGPQAKFITAQGIEIINRILLTPVDTNLAIKDIRLSYKINQPVENSAPIARAIVPEFINASRLGLLNASASTDTENNNLQYKWSVVSGDAILFQSKFVPYALIFSQSEEPVTITLQVNDGIANSKLVEKTISNH